MFFGGRSSKNWSREFVKSLISFLRTDGILEIETLFNMLAIAVLFIYFPNKEVRLHTLRGNNGRGRRKAIGMSSFLASVSLGRSDHKLNFNLFLSLT